MLNAVAESPNDEAGYKPSVIVVEDEILIRSIFVEELRSTGLRVVECGSADEAWSYLQAGGEADLVFTDMVLPGSMDGNELARRINQAYPAIKMILTSGNRLPTVDVDYLRFLQKPYDYTAAIAVILKTLRVKY